jgi:cell division topological specificity factor
MMGILDFFFSRKEPTAGIAKERLQIVLAHERAGRDAPEFLPALQRELLAVVARYVAVKEDLIRVKLARHSDASVLEINIEFDPAKPAAKPVAPPPPSMRATRPRGKAAIRRH